jgi:hypothetical protein
MLPSHQRLLPCHLHHVLVRACQGLARKKQYIQAEFCHHISGYSPATFFMCLSGLVRAWHATLRARYATLRAWYATLRAWYATLRACYATLRASYAILRASYVALRAWHATLRAWHATLRLSVLGMHKANETGVLSARKQAQKGGALCA